MSLSSGEIAYQEEHINDNRQIDVIVAAAICLPLAYLAVALRFTARRLLKAKLSIDDWMVLVGLFLTTTFVVDGLVGLPIGLGKHFVLVPDAVAFAKNYVAIVMLYTPAISATKISILLLYRRIFPSRHFLQSLYAVGFLVLSYNVTTFFTFLLQCIPMEAIWNPSIDHVCINVNAALVALSAVNVLTDLVILVLPVPQLWHLHSSLTRKLQLIGIFLTGSFVTIISLVRVVYLSRTNLQDPSWTLVDDMIWSIAEACLAVICACLPTLGPIFQAQSTRNGKIGGSGGVSSGNSRQFPAPRASVSQDEILLAGARGVWVGRVSRGSGELNSV